MGRGGIFDRGVETVSVAQQDPADQIGDDVAFHGSAQRIGYGLAGLRVEQLENFLDRTALRLGTGPAGHRFGYRVERGHAQFGIGGDHRIADRAQRHFGQLALAVERLLERLALADVLRLRHEIARLPMLVAYHRHAQLQVHCVAVLVEVALLQLIGVALAGQQLAEQFHVGVEIVRMGDGGDVQRQQLVLAIAEHLAHRGIDAQEAAVRMDQGHADRGVLKRAEETLLAFLQLELQRAPLGDVDERREHATHRAALIDVRLKIAVHIATLVSAERLALVAGHLPGKRTLQGRTHIQIIAPATDLDQGAADQLCGVDSQPGAMGFVGVDKAPRRVDVREQCGRATQHPRGPFLRLGFK